VQRAAQSCVPDAPDLAVLDREPSQRSAGPVVGGRSALMQPIGGSHVPAEPTLGELARLIERMESEFSRRLAELAQAVSQMVTRDLYEAHRSAMQDDIAELRGELRAERERRVADRRMVHSALLAAGLSLLVSIIGGALMAALKLT